MWVVVVVVRVVLFLSMDDDDGYPKQAKCNIKTTNGPWLKEDDDDASLDTMAHVISTNKRIRDGIVLHIVHNRGDLHLVLRLSNTYGIHLDVIYCNVDT